MGSQRGLRAILLSVLTIALCSAGGRAQNLRIRAERNEFDGGYYPAVADRLIVRFRSTADALQIAQVNEGIGAKPIEIIPELRVQTVKLPPGVSVDKARAYYKQSGTVAYAEPDWVWFRDFTPNDPRFNEQWAHKVAKSEKGWDIDLGSPSVVIAVIDGGVEISHEDHVEHMWRNPDEVPGNNKDDDGNGFVDDIFGWNFAKNQPDVTPDDHGTHVAGIAAGVINNKKGIAGVAGRCAVMTLDVFGGTASTSAATVAKAIIYAANEAAHVINMSLGGKGQSQVARDAIDFAFHPSPAGREGLVIVAAAGNDDEEIGESNFFSPVCEDGDENMVLGVASTGPTDKKASYSNFGDSPCVDVSAPGGDQSKRDEDGILSSVTGNTYDFFQGTSMASPFAAGLAALCKSVGVDLTNIQIRDIIIQTADNIEDKQDDKHKGKMGSGRVNVAAAVKLALSLSKDFEPNNSLAQAKQNTLVKVGSSISSSLSAPSDPDYFFLPITAKKKLDVILTPPAGVSVGMRVLREFGGVMLPNLQPDGTLKVTFTAFKGNYFILVYSNVTLDPWPRPRYRFTVQPSQE